MNPTHPFVSYAQNREDVVLARALEPDRHEGFYVDVGAGHPVFDSVTAAFSERGWCGVNIEPLQREHALLTAARPRDVNLNVAVGANAGVAKLFEGPAENRESSTMVTEFADAYRDEGQEFLPREVRVRTLAQITDEHVSGAVDFLKVDVEGWERDVLEGVDWDLFRPRVIVIEATVPNSTEPSHDAWEPLVIGAGYELALFDGLNRFYSRIDEPDLRDRLAAPANVLDHYVVHEWVQRERAALDRVVLEELAVARLQAAIARQITEIAEVSRSARVAQSRELALDAELDQLAEALAAAQHQTRRALADRDDVTRHAHALQTELDGLQTELDALRATKTFRYTNGLRRRYAHLIGRELDS